MAITGYCVKCKKKQPMQNPGKKKMKNGHPMAQGTCPDCGTKITRILPSKYA